MFQTLFALLTRQNHASSSLLEEVGDYFILPLGYGLGKMRFQVITKNNYKFLYDVPYEFSSVDSLPKGIALRALGVLLSPLAIVGFLIKLVALLQSSRMREIYFHWRKPASIEYEYLVYRKKGENKIARMYNNINIINSAISESKAALLLDDIVHHYKEWLIYYIEDGFVPGYFGWGSTSMNLTPKIEECVCSNSGNFNRFLNQRRQRIEENLANYLSSRESKSKIIYLSLGADGLLQELMMAHIFLSQGINADIHLVDPNFNIISEDRATVYRRDHSQSEIPKIDISQCFVDFLKAVAKELGLTINIFFYKDVSDVTVKDFDIITAIDFDEIFKEKSEGFGALCDAQSRLKVGGRLYLSYDVRDFIYDRTSCLYSSHVDELILKREVDMSASTDKQKRFKRWHKPPLSERLQRHASWSPLLFHQAAEMRINDMIVTTDDTPAVCHPAF